MMIPGAEPFATTCFSTEVAWPDMCRGCLLQVATDLEGNVLSSVILQNATECVAEVTWTVPWRVTVGHVLVAAVTALMLTACLCRISSPPLFSLPRGMMANNPLWCILPDSNPSPLWVSEGVRTASTFWLGMVWGNIHQLHFEQFWSVYVVLGLPTGYLYRRMGGTQWMLCAGLLPAHWILSPFWQWDEVLVGLFLGIGIPSVYLGWSLAGAPIQLRTLYVADVPQRFGVFLLLVIGSTACCVHLTTTAVVLVWDRRVGLVAAALAGLYTSLLGILAVSTTTILAFLHCGTSRTQYLALSSLLHVGIVWNLLRGKTEMFGPVYTRAVDWYCWVLILYVYAMTNLASGAFIRWIDVANKGD